MLFVCWSCTGDDFPLRGFQWARSFSLILKGSRLTGCLKSKTLELPSETSQAGTSKPENVSSLLSWCVFRWWAELLEPISNPINPSARGLHSFSDLFSNISNRINSSSKGFRMLLKDFPSLSSSSSSLWPLFWFLIFVFLFHDVAGLTHRYPSPSSLCRLSQLLAIF